jgi:cell division protein FtsI (penicillin-binding protein 3)
MTDDGLRYGLKIRTLYDDRGGPVRAQAGAARNGSQFRLRLCMFVAIAAFSILSVRLAHVTFGMGATFDAIRAETEKPFRREVVDRAGRPLIMNSRTTGLAVDGRDVWDVAEVVDALSAKFPDIDAERLQARLERHQYTLVLDNLLPQERQEVIALGLPGMRFPEITSRAYPQGDLAAHVLGYTIPGKGGAVGVERALERRLSGGQGPLALSLDLTAQQILEDELAVTMAQFGAKAAFGVLLDVHTGEVRALASLPDYNPNRPGASPAGARRNRAMSDVYELGSAFKPLTAALALELGEVNLTETFDVSRPIEVGGWPIEDYSRKTKPLTMSEVIQHSSNIGTVMMVQRIGAERFEAMLATLGLTEELETELPEGRSPMVSSTWRPAELASSSYGHGIAVSPLQLAAAFAATVNGGTFHTPTFVSGGVGESRRAFSAATSARMRIVMRKTVTEGTGRNAEVRGYYPIGKTATADKPRAGGYDDDGELLSSFIGAFPGYDPQYVLLVSFDEPEGTKQTYGYATAGYVAAPAFRRIVERAAPALGLMPVGDDVAFDGFLGLRRQGPGGQPVSHDALATLLAETIQ